MPRCVPICLNYRDHDAATHSMPDVPVGYLGPRCDAHTKVSAIVGADVLLALLASLAHIVRSATPTAP